MNVLLLVSLPVQGPTAVKRSLKIMSAHAPVHAWNTKGSRLCTMRPGFARSEAAVTDTMRDTVSHFPADGFQGSFPAKLTGEGPAKGHTP